MTTRSIFQRGHVQTNLGSISWGERTPAATLLGSNSPSKNKGAHGCHSAIFVDPALRPRKRAEPIFYTRWTRPVSHRLVDARCSRHRFTPRKTTSRRIAGNSLSYPYAELHLPATLQAKHSRRLGQILPIHGKNSVNGSYSLFVVCSPLLQENM